MTDDIPLFDLSQLNFEEFVSFFFNHDIDKEEYWYQEAALQNFDDFDDKACHHQHKLSHT